MKKGFTLIELLVVIAIIAILAAILFPVFAQAKNAAKKTVSLSNMKQIGTASTLYYADFDDWMYPLYSYNRNDTTYPTAQGFHYFGLLIQPYVKNFDILNCPNDRADDVALHDAQGRSRFDPNSTLKHYVIAANTSYGFNYRYLNTQIFRPDPNGTNPTPFYFVGKSATTMEFPASTIMMAEATMKDRRVPSQAPNIPPATILNPIGYSRIEPPFGSPPSRPGWNAFTYPDARSQGGIWPRFNEKMVIVSWLDGHVKTRPVKSLVGEGTTREEVDRFWNGRG